VLFLVQQCVAMIVSWIQLRVLNRSGDSPRQIADPVDAALGCAKLMGAYRAFVAGLEG
jgi:hypothetical protein